MLARLKNIVVTFVGFGLLFAGIALLLVGLADLASTVWRLL